MGGVRPAAWRCKHPSAVFPVNVPPKKRKSSPKITKQYFDLLQNNKTVQRLIKKFIGDTRWKLAGVNGVKITAVHPDDFTVTRNGRDKHFASDFDRKA